MSDRTLDYLALACAVSPIVAVFLGVIAWGVGLTALSWFFFGFTVTASIGCIPLLRAIWMYGIHNDR